MTNICRDFQPTTVVAIESRGHFRRTDGLSLAATRVGT